MHTCSEQDCQRCPLLPFSESQNPNAPSPSLSSSHNTPDSSSNSILCIKDLSPPSDSNNLLLISNDPICDFSETLHSSQSTHSASSICLSPTSQHSSISKLRRSSDSSSLTSFYSCDTQTLSYTVSSNPSQHYRLKKKSSRSTLNSFWKVPNMTRHESLVFQLNKQQDRSMEALDLFQNSRFLPLRCMDYVLLMEQHPDLSMHHSISSRPSKPLLLHSSSTLTDTNSLTETQCKKSSSKDGQSRSSRSSMDHKISQNSLGRRTSYCFLTHSTFQTPITVLRKTSPAATHQTFITPLENGSQLEHHPLLNHPPSTLNLDRKSIKGMLVSFTNSMWKRFIILCLIPVIVVVSWCAIPFPVVSSDSINDKSPKTNFFFFLFVYYGMYSFTTLMLITTIFQLYYLDWWPRHWSPVGSVLSFWAWSLVAGCGVYAVGLAEYPICWGLITVATMIALLLVAFNTLRSRQAHVRQERRWSELTPHERARRVFLDSVQVSSNQHSSPRRYQEGRHQLHYFFKKLRSQISHRLGNLPNSYRRFMWFIFTLFLACMGLFLNDSLAHRYLSTLPHSTTEGVIYVYSIIGITYTLDFLTDRIIMTQIHSWPLSTTFRLYYYMTYFVFYRNLFARLRHVEQFAVIQLFQVINTVVVTPLIMTRQVHEWGKRWWNETRSLEEYRVQMGRNVFLRQLAENVTMMGFLGWVVVLHYGPNQRFYPYFQFEEPGEIYNIRLTLFASVIVWGSEMMSGYITRLTLKRYFRLSVTREAVKDFYRYPDMVVVMMLVAIHILQDMLLSLVTIRVA